MSQSYEHPPVLLNPAATSEALATSVTSVRFLPEGLDRVLQGLNIGIDADVDGVDAFARMDGRHTDHNPVVRRAAPDTLYRKFLSAGEPYHTVRLDHTNADSDSVLLDDEYQGRRLLLEGVIKPGFDTSDYTRTVGNNLLRPARRRDAITAAVSGVGIIVGMWGSTALGTYVEHVSHDTTLAQNVFVTGFLGSMAVGFTNILRMASRNRRRNQQLGQVAGIALLDVQRNV